MPGRIWPFWRPPNPSPEPSGSPEPPAPAGEQSDQPQETTGPDGILLEVELHESRAAEARLRQNMANLLRAHRQQANVLERTRKAAQATESELALSRKRLIAVQAEIADMRTRSSQQGARIGDLEAQLAAQTALQAAHEALARERDHLQTRLTEVTRSRDGVQLERDRLGEQVASLHALIAARDAEIAAIKVAEDDWKERVRTLGQEVADLRTGTDRLKEEAARIAPLEAAHTTLQLEHDSLAARWEVARAQLDEAEQSLRSSQATIKAAQRLSASVEWRGALDGVLDAASELVRFERGTLALVDGLQDELKIEAAKNSPIAVSEMSRFKVGEGIAGWALSHREPVLVRDSRSDTRFKASDPTHLPRSFVAVPLLSGTEGLGVLTLARSANDPFDDHDLRSLARVANDAATALINARLVHLLKERRDQLTTLVSKAKDLWLAGDLGQVVEFVLTSAQELAGGTASLLALRDPRSQELEVLGSSGIPDDVLKQPIAWGAPAAMDVLRSGKPWASTTREMLPPNMADAVERAGLLSVTSVPCVTQPPRAEGTEGLLSRADLDTVDEVAGVLQVYRRSADPIPAGQLEQLQSFAEHAAVAIRNVRRTEKVKGQLLTSASLNARLLGRQRYINQLHYRIQQLENELAKFKAA